MLLWLTGRPLLVLRQSHRTLLTAHFAEPLPTLQFDRNIPVAPQKVVEGFHVELVASVEAGIGKELHDLDFASLI